ncbi:MAG TPA: MCE family protein [Acidimicrobiales bacterium]|nr:MCE family protein [Acidimicrobiales bacterium]
MRGTVIKLALFVVLCTFLTGALAFTIGNVQSVRIGPVQFLDDSYELAATFDDVTGLLINDNVKVAGVGVGKVTRIQVEKGRAEVTFRVKKQMKLPSDTRAAVRWRNLLGQRYLYLYPGEASTVLRGGDHVRETISVVDLGELFNRLGPVVKAVEPGQVNQFLDTVVGALDGNEAKVGQALDDLATVAGALGERDAAIGRLVENLNTVSGTIVDRDREIRAILDNLVTVSRTFNEHTDVIDRAVTELGDFSGHLGAILTNNRTEIDRIITNLTSVVAVVQQKLPTVDTVVTNLDDTALRLFNASKYGEWLNQTIPCGKVGYPNSVESACTPPPATAASGTTSSASGVDAVRQLVMTMASRAA